MAILFALLITLGAWVIYETSAIEIEHVPVYISDLPAELEGFCIVQISDFHGRKLLDTGRLVTSISNAKPDIIALTGDYVSRHLSEMQNIFPFIKAVGAVAPVYGVSGNHDYWVGWESIAEQLRSAGVQVLENEHTVIARGNSILVLGGVNDPYTGNADLPTALRGAPAAPTVVLAHAPTWFEVSKNDAVKQALARVDLTLAGHTHGGQIKIPFAGALSSSSGRLFPRDYVEGLTNEGNGWLHISRGIGYTFLPIRFLSRAQVAIITLRTE